MPLHCLSTFPTDTRSLAESRDWFLHIRLRAVSMAPSQSEIASPALEQKPKRVYGRKRDREAGSVLSRCFIASICRVSKRIEKWPPGNSLRRSGPRGGRGSSTLPLCDGLPIDPLPPRRRVHALLTILYRSTDRLRRCRKTSPIAHPSIPTKTSHRKIRGQTVRYLYPLGFLGVSGVSLLPWPGAIMH